MSEPSPLETLDPVIHERTRLAITAAMASRRAVDFLELKALLSLTDGNLAGHIRTLEKAGYVEVAKSFVGRKPRTTYGLTTKGRKAFERHVNSLEALLFRSRK